MAGYTFKRGATIRFAVNVTSGDAAGATMSARMKQGPGGDATADFEVEERFDGDTLIGWYLTIPASRSVTLPQGTFDFTYRLDLRGGDTRILGPFKLIIFSTPSSDA